MRSACLTPLVQPDSCYLSGAPCQMEGLHKNILDTATQEIIVSD